MDCGNINLKLWWSVTFILTQQIKIDVQSIQTLLSWLQIISKMTPLWITCVSLSVCVRVCVIFYFGKARSGNQMTFTSLKECWMGATASWIPLKIRFYLLFFCHECDSPETHSTVKPLYYITSPLAWRCVSASVCAQVCAHLSPASLSEIPGDILSSKTSWSVALLWDNPIYLFMYVFIYSLFYLLFLFIYLPIYFCSFIYLSFYLFIYSLVIYLSVICIIF